MARRPVGALPSGWRVLAAVSLRSPWAGRGMGGMAGARGGEVEIRVRQGITGGDNGSGMSEAALLRPGFGGPFHGALDQARRGARQEERVAVSRRAAHLDEDIAFDHGRAGMVPMGKT